MDGGEKHKWDKGSICVNDNHIRAEKNKKQKQQLAAKSCFSLGEVMRERPRECLAGNRRFIISLINKRLRRQMAGLLFTRARCSLKPLRSEHLYREGGVWGEGGLLGGSAGLCQMCQGAAKLECRHKPEVTLIDYLESICIFYRVVMGRRCNGTSGQNGGRGAVNDVFDYDSPPHPRPRRRRRLELKTSKGLSSRNE